MSPILISVLENHPHEHYTTRQTWLRAAILGSYDGLVSISSLLMGVAAGYSGGSVTLRCFLSSTIIEFVPFRHFMCVCAFVCPPNGNYGMDEWMYLYCLTVYKQKGEEVDPSFSPFV